MIFFIKKFPHLKLQKEQNFPIANIKVRKQVMKYRAGINVKMN